MLTIILVVTLLLGLGAWEAKKLVRLRKWGELIVASAIWLFATTYAALVMSPFNLINPNRVIISVLDFIYSSLF